MYRNSFQLFINKHELRETRQSETNQTVQN